MPEPYYERDGITIYNGDCKQIMGGLTYDCIITDPPYGSGRHADFRKGRAEGELAGAHVYDEWDRFSLDWLPGANVPIAAFTSHGNLAKLICALGPAAKVAFWRKTNPQPVTPPTEPIAARWLSLPAGAEFRAYNDDSLYHPTQKPIGLMRWILGFVPPDWTILDPFMGGGSTLRAAADLGRRAIGIELDETYCATTVRRLSQHALVLS